MKKSREISLSAQPIMGRLHKFQGETGFSVSWGSTLIALKAGLMKPRKGFTPVMGNKNPKLNTSINKEAVGGKRWIGEAK